VAPIRLKKVIDAPFIREALEISILKVASAVWTKADTAAATTNSRPVAHACRKQ